MNAIDAVRSRLLSIVRAPAEAAEVLGTVSPAELPGVDLPKVLADLDDMHGRLEALGELLAEGFEPEGDN